MAFLVVVRQLRNIQFVADGSGRPTKEATGELTTTSRLYSNYDHGSLGIEISLNKTAIYNVTAT